MGVSDEETPLYSFVEDPLIKPPLRPRPSNQSPGKKNPLRLWKTSKRGRSFCRSFNARTRYLADPRGSPADRRTERSLPSTVGLNCEHGHRILEGRRVLDDNKKVNS